MFDFAEELKSYLQKEFIIGEKDGKKDRKKSQKK